jgi:hypothetical protein
VGSKEITLIQVLEGSGQGRIGKKYFESILEGQKIDRSSTTQEITPKGYRLSPPDRKERITTRDTEQRLQLGIQNKELTTLRFTPKRYRDTRITLLTKAKG